MLSLHRDNDLRGPWEGCFVIFVSVLIKEWQPYIHDYILCYLLWLQGQTNKPCNIAITFSIKPPCSYYPNTCLSFLPPSWWREHSTCVNARLLSPRNENADQPLENVPGPFSNGPPCHRFAKCSANSSPLMFYVCRANWPQMPGFYREKYIFSAAACLASSKSEVIIYLICSPNKLLTLIFVSQHVSSWFVIESQ